MRPSISTRQWKHYEGYKYLAPWTNAVILRFLIRKFTQTLPRSEYRSKTQLDDAGRSVVSNIEEGYKRPTTKQYLDFIGFSQGSLEEIKGNIKQVYQDGFLKSKPGSSLVDLKIDLEEVKGLLKESKGGVSLEVLYLPLKCLKGSQLTLEIFLELINKTDWLFRRLVESLEEKLVRAGSLKKKYKNLAFGENLVSHFTRNQKQADDFDEELKQLIKKRETR